MSHRFGRDQRGFVIVWCGFLMFALLAVSAFSIDLGNWYVHVQRAQRAADAAALAGDPYLPGDPTTATQIARQTLLSNGVSASFASSADIHVMADNPNALSVTVETQAANTFLRIVGGPSSNSFKRTGIAFWQKGLRMGSGINLLGGHEPFDPSVPGDTPWGRPAAWDGMFWMGIQGSQAPKIDGDRLMAGRCNDPAHYSGPGYPPPGGVDFCTGESNDEFNPRGYAYHVNVVPGAGVRNLIIQVFDPGYAEAGGTDCTGVEGTGVYLPDPTFCAGDEDGHDDLPTLGPALPPDDPDQHTYYGLFADSNATTPLVVCQDFAGVRDARTADAFAQSWIHKWYQVCPAISVDTSKAQDFVLRVWSVGGAGVNDFVIRAGFSSTTDGSGVDRPYSQDHIILNADDMAIYNQYSGGATRFPVMQVDSSFAGQTIEMQFYDVGDVRNPATGDYATGTISLVTDDGASPGVVVPGSCDWTLPPDGTWAPVPGCVATTVGGGMMQGQMERFQWHVPSNYSCTATGPLRGEGCWIAVRMDFGVGMEVHDFTTWTVKKPPSPLHLIK